MTKRLPGCSVAVAAYRGEKYIGELLESLFAQTMTLDEIVICDDSPDDLTELAVKPFIGRPKIEVRYSRNISRLGVSANFERAISLTTREIILLADQDDVWLPDKTARLVEAIGKAPKHPAAAFCDSELCDQNLEPLGLTHWQVRGFKPERFARGNQLDECCRLVPAAGHDMAFEHGMLDVLLPLPPLDKCHDTWIGCVFAAAESWQVVPEALTRFRQHGGNLSAEYERRGLFAKAHDSIVEDSSGWYAELFAALYKRLALYFESFGDIPLGKARRRARYSKARHDLSPKFVRRILPVFDLLLSGKYRKYGHGWLNAVQDLFLRSVFKEKGK